jgi:hypothetical protein
MSDVFVLGCERSGSTWLLNILDSSPETECWMEPCAPYAQFFDGLPGRFERAIDEERVEQSLRAGFRRLNEAKYPLMAHRGGWRGWEDVDRAVMNGWSRLTRAVASAKSLAADRWRLLHLHEREVARDIRVRKSSLAVTATKELRLNLHARCVARAFPKARFVVTIREPAKQIGSVIRQLRRGALGELRQSLPTFMHLLHAEARCVGWADAARELRAADDLPALLSLWWLVNYDALLGALDEAGRDVLVVEHERIAVQPGSGARELLAFAGVAMSESTERFLRWSTSGDDRESSVGMRRSAQWFAARARVDEPSALASRVAEVIGAVRARVKLAGRLAEYLSGLEASDESAPRLRMAA